MKYEQPKVRDLTGGTAAGGPPIALTCLSGVSPGERCRNGGDNVGPCALGGSAGYACNEGLTANVPTPDCDMGGVATECVAGDAAGLVQ